MKLSEKLAHQTADEVRPERERPITPPVPVVPHREEPVLDALLTLKARVGAALFERLGNRMNDPSLAEEDLVAFARDAH